MIHSLEVRTIFSLFVLKKHMLGFAQIISVFRAGWRFARVGVGYPVSGTCSRSSFCKWRTGAWQFLCERIKMKGYTVFLSKVKRKFVNNSGSDWYGSDCIILFYFILALGVHLARM